MTQFATSGTWERECPICGRSRFFESELLMEIWDTMDEVDQAGLYHNPISYLQAFWDLPITAEAQSKCEEK